MPPDVPEYPDGSCEAALFAAMQARDPATGRHCDRVVALSVALAQACGLPEPEQAAVAVAARLHDVGKIGTPDRVLFSPKRLEADDWEIMKSHAATGADIIMKSAMPQRDLIAHAGCQGTISRCIRASFRWRIPTMRWATRGPTIRRVRTPRSCAS
ncbi:hypothetical protein G6F22_017229 [Rhizopus arrhizus]|nr:hypothetical protein G6F22_017229 [Rhizopus arrhizus]